MLKIQKLRTVQFFPKSCSQTVETCDKGKWASAIVIFNNAFSNSGFDVKILPASKQTDICSAAMVKFGNVWTLTTDINKPGLRFPVISAIKF